MQQKTIIKGGLNDEIHTECCTAHTLYMYWLFTGFKTEYSLHTNQLSRPAGAVRLGDYKLVESYETGELELYNIRNDISESEDLSGKMVEKTQELYKLLFEWRKKANANMPGVNPDKKKGE